MTLMEPEIKILKWIKPNSEDKEKALATFEEIRKRIEKALAGSFGSYEVMLEGSMAKDTWLKNDPEMDVFIVFSEELNKERLKEIVEKLSETLKDLSPMISFAEHPYLTIKKDMFSIDIVPAIKMGVNLRPRTAVDRTPLHTEYVLKNTDERLRDEIRVAKAFMKGIGVYGAEIKVGGFSGYLVELLVIKYGGFRELLEATKDWKQPVSISLEGDGKKLKDLRERYPKSSMLLPDPADPTRNVSAALTRKKLGEFVLASWLYLEHPSLYYFSNKLEEMLVNEIGNLPLEFYAGNAVVVDIKLQSPIHPEVLWGELKKSSASIKNLLERHGFGVIRCDEWSDERSCAAIACLMEEKLLGPMNLVLGPPFHLRENAAEFIEKYQKAPMSGPWLEEDGRLRSLTIRKKLSPAQIIEDSLDEVLGVDLKKGSVRVYRLSQTDRTSNYELHRWLKLFLMGKPKWLLPLYFQSALGEPREEDLFS
ncbi:MAG: CCA tRNA nucleotidyltransferase [Thermoprotei archaeon]|uniref:CCA-adding enzyme n=1 Tax=Fervidicoccus fontis TaxID=683846 RepID=A0A7J3SJR2_9CREN|nr:CCA tRNA nucleotidyltransferase [Thermoprotei archaeon]